MNGFSFLLEDTRVLLQMYSWQSPSTSKLISKWLQPIDNKWIEYDT